MLSLGRVRSAPWSSASAPGIASRFLAFLVVFLAFGLRAYHLDELGLGADEAFSVHASSWGLAGILQIASTGEPHPPLYYLFLGLWNAVFGISEYSVRFPSLVASVTTTAVLIKLSDRLGWSSAGLVAGFLFACSPYQVWSAQDTRMYALAAMFGLVAMYFALRALPALRGRHLGPYVLSMLLGLYTHYYAIFLFAFINVLILMDLWRGHASRSETARWLGAQCLVALFYLPWVAFAQRIALSYNYYALRRGNFDLLGILKEAVSLYSVFDSVWGEQTLILSMAFLAIGAIGLRYSGHSIAGGIDRLRCGFLCGYVFSPLLLSILISLLRPMLQARHLMVSAPAFYLAFGLGVAGLYRRSPVVGVMAGLLLASAQLASLNNYYTARDAKGDFRTVVAYIQEHLGPDDAIVLDGWGQVHLLWYYYTLRFGNPVPNYLFPLNENGVGAADLARLEEIMSRHRGVWLLDSDAGNYDPQRQVEGYLARAHYQALSYKPSVSRVTYYASGASARLASKPLNLECNQEVVLRSFQQASPSARAGELVPLVLDWQAIRRPSRNYAVSWRLLDASGHTVWQRDSQPVAGFAPSQEWKEGAEVQDRYALPLPAYLPPGEYYLIAIVYDQASGKACEPHRDGKPISDGPVALGSIEVLDAAPSIGLQPVSPSSPASLSFGGLHLIGLDAGAGPYRAGDLLSVRLWWHVGEAPNNDYSIDARLIGNQEEYSLAESVPLGPPTYNTSRWHSGRELITYLDLRVPLRAASGVYRLSLTIGDEKLGKATASSLLSIPVTARERSYQAPAIAHPTQAHFGDLISLLGYDLSPDPGQPVAAGQQLRLTLYWKALREVPESYKVFTHIEGDDGRIYGQADSIPLGGDAPTDSWREGEVLIDSYILTVSPDAPSGHYRLLVGLYEPVKGNRITLADGSSDSYTLATILTSGLR